MKYEELTHDVIGCAMEVHRTLGLGFPEVIYQRALAIEFDDHGITFEREKSLDLFYRDQKIGSRRVDFLVNNEIIVELKAVSDLDDSYISQVLNYLEAFNVEIGLLLNFGTPSLQFKRIHNNKLLNQHENKSG